MKTSLFACAVALAVCGCKGGARGAGAGNAATHEQNDNGKPGEARAGAEARATEAKEKDDWVQLTPESARAAGLELAPAQKRALSAGLSATARISLPLNGHARIAPRVAGRVASITVQLGANLRRGAIVAYVESPELGRARADYLSAVTRTRVADDNYRRERDLLAKGITSEREAREAESAASTATAEKSAAEARLRALGLGSGEIAALRVGQNEGTRFALRTPIEGTVLEIAATPGQTVEASTELVTVGNLSQLWVILDVFEDQLALVRLNQQVSLRVDAYPDRVFSGRIAYVGDVVNEKTRAVQVRVVVSNRERLLKPGMFAAAEIATSGPAAASAEELSAVVVPRSAIQQLGPRRVVFVPAGGNKFRAVEVEIGRTSVNEAEIVRGLDAGTSVVSRGAFILKSELSKESLEAE